MSKTVPNFNSTDRLLPIREVLSTISVGRTTLYAWVKTGEFPRPRKIGAKRVAWLSSDVTNWVASRPAA